MTQTMTINGADVTIHYKNNLPDAFNGCVAQLSDTKYLIIINADHDQRTQDRALEHELMHIRNKDLDRQGDINEMEKYTHWAVEHRKEV